MSVRIYQPRQIVVRGISVWLWHVIVDGVAWQFAWSGNDGKIRLSFQTSDGEWSSFVTSQRRALDLRSAEAEIVEWSHAR